MRPQANPATEVCIAARLAGRVTMQSRIEEKENGYKTYSSERAEDAMSKRIFTVRAVNDRPVWERPGPWCVEASTPRGAFRMVRRHWPHSITDHVRRETCVLECEGSTSDMRGTVRPI